MCDAFNEQQSGQYQCSVAIYKPRTSIERKITGHFGPRTLRTQDISDLKKWVQSELSLRIFTARCYAERGYAAVCRLSVCLCVCLSVTFRSRDRSVSAHFSPGPVSDRNNFTMRNILYKAQYSYDIAVSLSLCNVEVPWLGYYESNYSDN